MDGIILVNKEKGMTSHDVVFKLRKLLKTKKIGHCGTLDPLATGVLVCVVNKSTKLANYLILDSKEYVATFKLGLATTTQDSEGEVVTRKEYLGDVNSAKVEEILSKYTGKLIQTPSIYSAIKVNGKKLYEYARNNEEVIIPKREVEIYANDLLEINDDEIMIRVKCSSGTYIRTLCYDIAHDLGYPGVLIALERTQSGRYKLEQTATLDQIEKDDYQLISISEALSDYETLEVDETAYRDVLNGKPLICEIGEDFVVKYQEEVVALYNASIAGLARMKRGLW